MFTDLGAEYLESSQYSVIALARDLDVEVEDYDDTSLSLANDLYFFNGKLIDPERFLFDFRTLARLIEQDTKPLREGGDLLLPSRGNPGPVPRLDQLSLAAYLEEKKTQGVSAEFIQLLDVMYLCMFGLETSEQSAYNLLNLVDTRANGFGFYGESDDSKRIRGGNSGLIHALEKKVAEQSPIHLGHRLVRIKDNSTQLILDFDVGGKIQTVKADQVVMALPFSTLRQVEGVKDLALSPAKKAAIEQLGYATSAKLFIGFSRRKWREKGNVLPPNLGTVFANGVVKEVRDASIHQAGNSGIILNQLSGKQGAMISKDVALDTVSHLETLYPGIKLLTDGNHLLKHWLSDPFAAGSYGCARVGHYSTMGGFENPMELAGRLVFAGEHMSMDWNGYMEGAVQTGRIAAELMLSKSLLLSKSSSS